MPKPTRLTKTVRKMTSSGRDTRPDYLLARLRSPNGLRTIPVFIENGPQRLIVILAAAKERFSQNTLLNRADLPERAVAPAVLHGRARFEPMHANHIERKIR